MYVATAICMIVVVIIIVAMAALHASVDPNDTSVDPDLSRGENSLPPVDSDFSIYVVSDEPQNPDAENYIEQSVPNSNVHSGPLALVTSTGKEPTQSLLGLVNVYANKNDGYGLTTTALILNATAVEHLNDFIAAFRQNVARGNDSVLLQDAYCSFADLTAKGKLTGYPDLASGYSVRFGITNPGDNKLGEGKYLWLEENAYRYGFILRYPVGKEAETKIAANAMCYRYVGTAHSVYIKNNGITLDEYIDEVRQHDYKNPIRVTYDNVVYKIYYKSAEEGVASTLISVPTEYPYEISGDNVGGFIITVTEQEDVAAPSDGDSSETSQS